MAVTRRAALVNLVMLICAPLVDRMRRSRARSSPRCWMNQHRTGADVVLDERSRSEQEENMKNAPEDRCTAGLQGQL